ncbi:ankyrin repeat-containing domain protein [Trichophaea hybrida]|nr:ankyrin repeat-containing domain protein [Trichophaea hybrida]
MASFQQRVYNKGYTFLIPSVSFYPVIPVDSEIFTVVEKGDSDGLIRLLATGKGSLRDMDTVGRTLLHYACTGMQPQMCKFLLENGADPNVLARPCDEVEYGPVIYGNPNPDIINQFMEQEKILLDAGADPLLGMYPQWNYLTYALRVGELALLKLILSYSDIFFHLEGILDECGNTPLLYAATDIDVVRGAKKVEELVSRGANAKSVNKHGNTLLHIILGSSPIWFGLNEGVDKTTSYISLFIRAGADVRAVNVAGETPSHIAYRFGHGEFWERSLIENGYDAADICSIQYQSCCSSETILSHWEGRCEDCDQYLGTTILVSDDS